MESFVNVPGGQLWTSRAGSGPAVLLVSGGPGCCDYLEPVANMLEGRVTAIRFDARGCGRSSHWENYRLADSLSDLEALRRHYGLEDWVVLGHSAGADLALAYALEHRERTRALVCLAGGRVHNDRDWHAAYSRDRDAGLEAELDYAFPPNLDVNRQLNAEWKAYCKRPGVLRELGALDIPALFVYGSKDIRPAWPIEQVANLLPDASWHLIEGAAHNLWLTHAPQLQGLLREFVGS